MGTHSKIKMPPKLFKKITRITAVISDGITDSLILKEEVGDVLIDVLRTFAPEYVEED